MRTNFGLVSLGLVGLLASACQLDDETSAPTDVDAAALAAVRVLPDRRACDQAGPGEMACTVRVRIQSDSIAPIGSPVGLHPADLVSAYKISQFATGTVAVIEAYDDPNVESDLAKYRAQFGLPACTTANGCFRKVSQTGQASPLPRPDRGWATESALDTQMVSAACPSCKILVVEASSQSANNLGAAVNIATALGAQVVSMSWGGTEDSTVTTQQNTYYNHPGVALFAAAGDDGYGVQFPATASTVIAVAGTTLTKSTSARGWAEAAWSMTGSGCSKYIAKPSWQKDTGCSKRTVGDVAAVGDPNTGVATYDSYGGTGWEVYGGTSVATPLVATFWLTSGHALSASAQIAYANTADFNDITTGTNGACGTAYLCHAGVGFDGPTGVGTPNGLLFVNASAQSCSHADCVSGAALFAGCDVCSTDICAVDPYCCTTAWDNACVGEVTSVCGETCSTQNTCPHAECTSGAKLAAGCDSCASAVCAVDGYCCSTQWDNICVTEVGTYCGETCTP